MLPFISSFLPVFHFYSGVYVFQFHIFFHIFNISGNLSPFPLPPFCCIFILTRLATWNDILYTIYSTQMPINSIFFKIPTWVKSLFCMTFKHVYCSFGKYLVLTFSKFHKNEVILSVDENLLMNGPNCGIFLLKLWNLWLLSIFFTNKHSTFYFFKKQTNCCNVS